MPSPLQKQHGSRSCPEARILPKRKQNQEFNGSSDVDVHDAAAVLREREIEFGATEPDEAEARALREASDDAVVDLPGFDVEPIGLRIDAVRRPEVREVEPVRKDHIRVRLDTSRGEHDASRQVCGDVGQIEGWTIAQPGPQKTPAFDSCVVPQTPVRQLRVGRGIDALSVAAPAPAMKVAAKAMRCDVRQREIATEVRTAISDRVCTPFEIAIQHDPSRAELDVLNASLPEPSGRSDEVPTLSHDTRGRKSTHRCLFRQNGGLPVSFRGEDCDVIRQHLRVVVLAAGVVAAAATLSAQAPASQPAQQAAQPALKPNAYRQLPPVKLYSGPAPLRADWPGLLTTPVQEGTSSDGDVIYNVVDPTYTAFVPDAARNTRTAVLVAPGGAFRQLSINSEGNRVATWLAERGVAAFVLKYRLVHQSGPPFSFMARMKEMPINVSGEPAVADTIRAIAMIRERAAEYAIDPDKLVAIGFSAGAHAVAHAAMNADVKARPNYVAPIYGGPFGGIPPIPAPDSAEKLPPIFLAMAQDDALVGADVREFYAQLFAKGYRPETHLYMSGGHGFGMNVTRNTSDLFIDQFFAWMQAQGLTRKPGDPDLRPRGRAK